MSLAYGVQQPADGGVPRPVARVRHAVLDLASCAADGLFDGVLPDPRAVLSAPVLNPFLALGRAEWQAAHARIRELLDDEERSVPHLLAGGTELLPFAPGDYVDFYSSLEHASNLGRMFRPDAEPLLPNWRHLPVGYHGRAGTVVVSGTPVRRPWGQLPGAEGEPPRHAPTNRLDIELELGFVTGGRATTLGEPVRTADAREHVFGIVLVNDWSARDIQRWEYVPLGPFLGKSFATSVSAWVVPLDELESARVPAPAQDPEPLDYLRCEEDSALDLDLAVELNGVTISRVNSRGLYWTIPQQLAHATANGAVIRPGDLFASGTISGPERGSEGSLIELTWNGRDPIALPDGERTFLEDGDVVTLRGATPDGSVALGDVTGEILPAA